MNKNSYKYHCVFDKHEQEYRATVKEFPSMSCFDKDKAAAICGMKELVASVLRIMDEEGTIPPYPSYPPLEHTASGVPVPYILEECKKIKAVRIPLRSLKRAYKAYEKPTDKWENGKPMTWKKFRSHVRRIINSDLRYPIIVDMDSYEDGPMIIDGMHRLLKAQETRKTHILVKKVDWVAMKLLIKLKMESGEYGHLD